MKNPLHYQLSEYDCGPTTMLNAISFLFEREEISPVVIRNVMLYCLDSYNGEGIMGKSGTSSAAMILREELCGQHNPYAKLFSPQRMNFRAGIGNLFTDLGESVRGLARGWFGKDSIQCTHMGCGLTWNEDEKTWECSCHGSRFDAHGKLLDNPAKKDIQ